MPIISMPADQAGAHVRDDLALVAGELLTRLDRQPVVALKRARYVPRVAAGGQTST
jgi:hypothetical protein